ncbi:hypothetical protein ACYCAX_01650 [Pseudomonas sp. MT3]|uniref:hypothetical protein n=1 Tax=Pseudomonas sp. ATCC 13867 TaxID=1294143 RepID=UPI0002C4E21B|nr:hypothetical protein [Pseudomonas sp. ATCC 13867]AGI24747.1 hypothetical protein H681_14385 [Pseudomonas sp. ATCC 13867]RFQ41848.1 hypothetical protein D0N87_01205 [Pseudomonas sp. ATCC 13867]
MRQQEQRHLRAVRTTAYNNEVAAELLQELLARACSEDQARRIRCARRQLLRDADALELVWQALSTPDATPRP